MQNTVVGLMPFLILAAGILFGFVPDMGAAPKTEARDLLTGIAIVLVPLSFLACILTLCKVFLGFLFDLTLFTAWLCFSAVEFTSGNNFTAQMLYKLILYTSFAAVHLHNIVTHLHKEDQRSPS